jgi:cobalt-zinc-cadmium efflux system membrane fusion protein
MMARVRAFLGLLGTLLSPLVVFALLGGVGYWGYRNEWKLPKLSELLSASAGKESSNAAAQGESTGSDEPFLFSTARVRLASPDAARRAGIVLEPVEEGPVQEVVTAPGSIEYDPARFGQVSTRAPGVVWKVYKQIGDPVTKGEVLALVDAADVGRIKTDFLQALAQIDVRTRALQRLEATKAVPEAQVREAEAALREARIRLLTQQQALVNLGLAFRMEEVTGLDDRKALHFLRLLGLSKELAARPDAENLSTNLLPLQAPFSGVVLRRNMTEGEVVGTGQLTGTAPPQFVIADVTRLWIMLDVRLEDLPGLDRRGGQHVTFYVDGHADRSSSQREEVPSGVIDWVSPEVDDKTHTVRIRVVVANPDGRLRPNTHGVGQIVIRDQPRATTVPTEAIQLDGGVSLVFVKISDREFEARPVLLGARAGLRREVLSSAPLCLASRLGLLAAPAGQGPLLEATTFLPRRERLSDLQPGQEVAATGSHALKSELFKDRIAGGDD